MTALHPGEDTGEGSGNGGGVAVVGGVYGFICLNSGGFFCLSCRALFNPCEVQNGAAFQNSQHEHERFWFSLKL